MASNAAERGRGTARATDIELLEKAAAGDTSHSKQSCESTIERYIARQETSPETTTKRRKRSKKTICARIRGSRVVGRNRASPRGWQVLSSTRLLEQKIDELPAAVRTVLVMRAIEEMSVEETAACLGIPEATVRTRFFRARRLLGKSITTDVTGALEEAFAFDRERCDRIVKAVLARITTSD